MLKKKIVSYRFSGEDTLIVWGRQRFESSCGIIFYNGCVTQWREYPTFNRGVESSNLFTPTNKM